MRLKGGRTKHTPKLHIAMHMPGIEIIAQCALEHSGILGNNSKTAAKIEQTDRRHIQPVDAKTTLK